MYLAFKKLSFIIFDLFWYFEAVQGVKSGVSSFRIRLTYCHAKASSKLQSLVPKDNRCKRRKAGMFYTPFVDKSCLHDNDFYLLHLEAVVAGFH